MSLRWSIAYVCSHSVLHIAPVALAVVDRVAVVRRAQFAFLNIAHFEISVNGKVFFFFLIRYKCYGVSILKFVKNGKIE